MFEQAISSTKPTAAINTSMGVFRVARNEIGEGHNKHSPGRVFRVGCGPVGTIAHAVAEYLHEGAGLLEFHAGFEANHCRVAFVKAIPRIVFFRRKPERNP